MARRWVRGIAKKLNSASLPAWANSKFNFASGSPECVRRQSSLTEIRRATQFVARSAGSRLGFVLNIGLSSVIRRNYRKEDRCPKHQGCEEQVVISPGQLRRAIGILNEVIHLRCEEISEGYGRQIKGHHDGFHARRRLRVGEFQIG